jgi:hypothetical protein
MDWRGAAARLSGGVTLKPGRGVVFVQGTRAVDGNKAALLLKDIDLLARVDDKALENEGQGRPLDNPALPRTCRPSNRQPQ